MTYAEINYFTLKRSNLPYGIKFVLMKHWNDEMVKEQKVQYYFGVEPEDLEGSYLDRTTKQIQQKYKQMEDYYGKSG